MNIRFLDRYTKSTPFSTDGTNLFLPWIMMTFVFLASLAMMGTFTTSNMIDGWNKSVTGSLSIQVLPAKDAAFISAETLENMLQDVDKVVGILQNTKGIKSIKVLSLDELETLLEPWLGEAVLDDEFPLPRLIDVTFDEDNPPDMEALQKAISSATPNALTDVHRIWISKLMGFAKTLKLTSWAVLLLVLLTTAISAIYATITGLKVHKLSIDLLHLIGAYDGYIAILLAKRTFIFSLFGSCIGLLLSVPVCLIASAIISDLEVGIASTATLTLPDIIFIILLPFMAAGLTGLSSYLTVKIKLKEAL